MQTTQSNSVALLKTVRQTGTEAWYFSNDLLREDDIWLASYPRSGSHFARFILVSARHFIQYGTFPEDLSGMKTIPDIHGGRLEFAEGPPRIIKTHFPFDPRYRHVIHLVRDPRDVVISYFHYSKGLPHLFSEPPPAALKLPRFIDLFLQGKVWPGKVQAHSASYTEGGNTGKCQYTCIHYEALLNEPRQEYRRLLQAARVDFPVEHMDALIQHTGFSNMQRLHHPETARAGLVESNPSYILRSGVAGKHAQVLRGRVRERVKAELENYLSTYGYR